MEGGTCDSFGKKKKKKKKVQEVKGKHR